MPSISKSKLKANMLRIFRDKERLSLPVSIQEFTDKLEQIDRAALLFLGSTRPAFPQSGRSAAGQC